MLIMIPTDWMNLSKIFVCRLSEKPVRKGRNNVAKVSRVLSIFQDYKGMLIWFPEYLTKNYCIIAFLYLKIKRMFL